MADPNHLEILSQGVAVWNQWREKYPEFYPDLDAADLHRKDLRQANFSKVDLNGVDLSGAYLSGAEFSEADLGWANLRGADLRRVLFRGADLNRADFSRTDLGGADFDGSTMGYTIFADVDLGAVKGLEAVRHDGPSSIGIDAIYRSQGKIPEIFLRGAGVPESFIVNMQSLVTAMSPIEFYSCFISYSSKDQDFAERLHADLQAKGVRCWFAPEDLKIGDPFRQRIDDAIRRYDKLLVVLSETSVASSWVESEVEAALERERTAKGEAVLFPIRLDEAVMKTGQAWAADIRRKRHMGDFSRWQDHGSYQKAFQRLLRDLQGVKSEEGT